MGRILRPPPRDKIHTKAYSVFRFNLTMFFLAYLYFIMYVVIYITIIDLFVFTIRIRTVRLVGEAHGNLMCSLIGLV
jgi:hypothetical protein